MPIVHIDMLAGRTRETKAVLLRRVTDAVAETLGVRREQVRVLIAEYPPQHWGVGGNAIAATEPDAGPIAVEGAEA